MTAVATLLPSRRAELVCWPGENHGHFLVRNRQTGETFQLGEQEQFLLARLDGRHSVEQIRAAFTERFGQPLSDDELAEFVQLADERGLLQRERCDAVLTTPPRVPRPAPCRRHDRSTIQHVTARLLTVVAGVLRWLAGFLNGVAQRSYWLRLKHLDYVPRPDDVFIVTYPRSGTTWMQMILYQLTTDGSMNFPHIAEYCPWFERSLCSARGFETRPAPRIFKSHLSYRQIPKGPCKYIYVARDGKDVALSCYHLHRHYNGYQGTFAEFFDRFLRGQDEFGSWFRHVRGWWSHRHDPNVLFLTYEELTRDLEGCIRKIIAFCGFDVPSERLPVILERCRFAFMKKHESQFDPALELFWEQGVQLNSFFRNGRVGEGTIHLSAEQEARFGEAFRRQMGGTGFDPTGADASPG